jgi:calcyphosin
LKGKLNPRRQALVDKAFLKFDKDGNGSIQAADIKGVYNTKMHPKVKSGQMTEAQVFAEFLSSFGDVNKDGSISRQVETPFPLNSFECLP